MVEMVRKKKGVRTLAIGDGANDVTMIQTADVGTSATLGNTAPSDAVAGQSCPASVC